MLVERRRACAMGCWSKIVDDSRNPTSIPWWPYADAPIDFACNPRMATVETATARWRWIYGPATLEMNMETSNSPLRDRAEEIVQAIIKRAQKESWSIIDISVADIFRTVENELIETVLEELKS